MSLQNNRAALGKLDKALALERAGDFARARALYAEVARKFPDEFDVIYSLALASAALGDIDDCARQFARACRLRPDFPDAHYNLGFSLFRAGRFAEARASYDRAIRLDPAFFEALTARGDALLSLGLPDEALADYERALAIRPDYIKALNNRGLALTRLKHFGEALASHDRAISRQAENADAWFGRGLALAGLKRFNEAFASHQRAVTIRPDFAEAWVDGGIALTEMGRMAEAVASCDRAIAIKPDFAQAWFIRGVALGEIKRIDDAIASFDKVIKLAPDKSWAHIGKARLLPNLGRHDEARSTFQRAIEADPADVVIQSNALFALNYHPDLSAEAIFAEYAKWDERRARPLAADSPRHDNDTDPERRLRVGYVSPDFREHSVGYFLERPLAAHDHSLVEVYAYSDLSKPDGYSARFEQMVDHWRRVEALDDEALAELIRRDRIDILVDLAGHTRGGRPLVFARRPAPLQYAAIGCGYTTGLSAIDFYMADAIMIPEGAEHLFAERPARLPVYTVYNPAPGMGDPGPLPARRKGYVTFGSLTRSIRVNHHVYDVWATILRRIPDARLALNSHDYSDASIRDGAIAEFVARGVAAERLDLGFTSPPWDAMREIDIGLDCFPHNSGTTLYETLYMGIPFVTLAGRPSVGLIGASVLTAAGHPEWIATTPEDYIDKAVALAADTDRLARLRGSLRAEMEASPNMDGAGYTRALEASFRQAWREWCARRASGDAGAPGA